jgi:dihydrofolate reductase
MRLSLIVAMTRQGVIGRAGKLPWRLSADLKRFKVLTMGHHLIMGRKTYDSLRKILPGRTSLVIKRLSSPYDYGFYDDGVPIALYDEVVAARKAGQAQPARFMPIAFCHSLQAALDLAAGDEEVFVIGGGEIFELALPLANRMYVTWVEADLDGDTRFPDIDWEKWREVSSDRHSADEKNEYDTTFCVYDRVTLEGEPNVR